MSTILYNGRLVLRDLRRRPTFALTVILTLAIGIGATTAAFALVESVFLRRLPIRDQDRVVSLWATKAPDRIPYIPWDVQQQIRDRNGPIADAAAYWVGFDPYGARYGTRLLHLVRVPVSGAFFGVLGVQPINHAVSAIDPMFAVRLSETGPDVVRRRIAQPQALTDVFAALAVTALLLAVLGLFGVLSAYVRERRREIAIRGALGATPMQLRSLVVMQTLVLAAMGIVCGAPLALIGPHALHKVVTDVGSVTWLTVVLVALLLLLAVAIATYGPTARAARVDARAALASE